MTWSIVAREPETGHLAIAVATRFFAVGSLVPHIRGGIGAVATQAFVSPLYGIDGITMLAAGHAPEEIVATLTARDDGREQRQFHLIDAKGNNAAFTGAKCVDWAGHLIDDNVSVAGNMLAGPQVIAETLSTFKKTKGKPLAERLLEAMRAGEDAGGDKRGKQSAALVIHRDQDYAWLNIRVDDSADPLTELERLYAVAQERYLYFAETMATRQNPDGMIDRREIDEKIAALEAARIAEGRPSASFATLPKLS
ncbi:DUF1028 domain-containing protein [Rhizobium rhizogenes]|uniref:Pilus assembly protein n=1 Tax=Rhizobium rhizogenes (strain K84 / ATCC BAA-868) TaxID=311403 RepID=B9JIY5_RHIR8|nr:DUF1028 domain-containing protein [Rhizobium rhizogenes]ACM29877.1 conserved hypothetical protein [Rhizobium rhizogenes K84]NTG76794.1 DUF1028 domain-containing protein [Rhizobium rhizogenes]NTI44840.1 DUF1028 domain-containing protein [Rhizobium rhizogenes]OCJ23592.1 pilus assembly protein [Agrobacterium sp. B131/95]